MDLPFHSLEIYGAYLTVHWEESHFQIYKVARESGNIGSLLERGNSILEKRDEGNFHYSPCHIHFKCCTLWIYDLFKNNLKTELFRFSASDSEIIHHFKEESSFKCQVHRSWLPSSPGSWSTNFTSLVALQCLQSVIFMFTSISAFKIVHGGKDGPKRSSVLQYLKQNFYDHLFFLNFLEVEILLQFASCQGFNNCNMLTNRY